MYIIASPVGAIWFVKPYFFLGIDPWAWRVETINKKPPIRTPSGPVAFWLDEEEARLSVTNVREEMAHVTLELGKQVGWYHGINKASLLLPCLSSCVKEHEWGNGLHLRWTALQFKALQSTTHLPSSHFYKYVDHQLKTPKLWNEEERDRVRE